MVVPHQHCPPFQCVYHFVNLYLCRLCIPNIVHDFCAMPKIMCKACAGAVKISLHFELFSILGLNLFLDSLSYLGTSSFFGLSSFFFWLSYFLVLLHFWAVLIFGVIFFLLIFIFWGIFIFEVVFFLVVFILVSFQIFGHLHFWGWANYPLLVPSVALTLSLDLCA